MVISASRFGIARTGGAVGRGFTGGLGGVRGGDAWASAGGGDGADDGEGVVRFGSSCTARAPLDFPASTFAADSSCMIFGTRIHNADTWTRSDRTNATQISGIVRTSCRLLRS